MLNDTGTFRRSRILVVEDDYMVAAALTADLKMLGLEVAGPVPSVETALKIVRASENIDGAILDINLAGTMVFPLADELDRLSLPFFFGTGYNLNIVPARHARKHIVQKPYDIREIIPALRLILPPDADLRAQAMKNNILALLPSAELTALLPSLSVAVLEQGAEIQRQHEPVEQVCFPTTCVGSIIAISPKGQQIEAGLVGLDGFTAFGLVADDHESPYQVVAQVGGECLTMPSSAFVKALDEFPNLRRLAVRFVRTLNIQVGYTALANGRFAVPQRLARWLLMLHDRTAGDSIAITHEYLAVTLGVRRAGVTNALHLLEGDGFIRSLRGRVLIRDRKRLLDFADDAYGFPEAEYSRLMGIAPKHTDRALDEVKQISDRVHSGGVG